MIRPVFLSLLAALTVCLSCGGTGKTQPAATPARPAEGVWVAGPRPDSRDLLAVDVLDATHAWAVGDIAPEGGAVLFSGDGGKSWTPIAKSTEVLAAVSFVSPQSGWVAGYAGRIQRTSDGGKTWQTQRVEREGEIFNSICFLDERRGWVAGGSGLVMHTQDGGATWEQVVTNREEDLWCVRFASSKMGWITGEGGLVLITTDGGATWMAQTTGTDRALIGLATISETGAVAVGDRGIIIRTEDGTAWTAVASNTDETLNSVAASPDGRLWAAGTGGTILGSTDGGKTWTLAPKVSSMQLTAIDMAEPGVSVAVGRKGTTQRFDLR